MCTCLLESFWSWGWAGFICRRRSWSLQITCGSTAWSKRQMHCMILCEAVREGMRQVAQVSRPTSHSRSELSHVQHLQMGPGLAQAGGRGAGL